MAAAKTDLKSIQTDGLARFDVDSDGFREVTEWVGNTDAMFGMDRDSDGLITNAGELFNSVRFGLYEVAYPAEH